MYVGTLNFLVRRFAGRRLAAVQLFRDAIELTIAAETAKFGQVGPCVPLKAQAGIRQISALKNEQKVRSDGQ